MRGLGVARCWGEEGGRAGRIEVDAAAVEVCVPKSVQGRRKVHTTDEILGAPQHGPPRST